MRPAARVALAAAGAVAAWAGWYEPRRLVVRRERLELPAWPAALDGFRVGVLSDVHAGVPHMGRAAIARAVARLAEQRPDVVLLLGDYVDASPLWGGRLPPDAVAEELARLHPPLGRFAVLGNHDWRRAGHSMWAALERAGIPVLENRSGRVDAPGGPVWIAGLADLRHRGPDITAALADVPADAPVLLASHDPDVHPGVPHRVALTLSGHVHGGQVAIPLLRRPMIPSAYGERYAHRHVVDDGRRLYVSSGLGTSGMPVRLLAPPEVVLLELFAARG